LRGVLDDPENDDAKRVYADELLQAGDPRGELIQLELALAGPLAIRRRDQLRQRHTELRAAWFSTWFPYKVGAIRTRGGFASSVRATFGQLRAAGALFATEPVVEVAVELDPANAAELAGAPWLGRLRRLIVRGGLGDAGLTALWSSPGVAQLRALNVTGCGVGPSALAGADLSSPGDALPVLDTLVLSGNPLGDAGLAGLGRWPGLARLETLYVSRARASLVGLEALLAGGALPRLRKLCLSRNALGAAAGAVIAQYADRLPGLRHLELVATGATLDGVAAIVAAKLPALATLDVRDNPVARDRALRPIAAGLAPYVRV
jgi:uncharacterized protein (TIGR02996 family)